MVGPHLSELKFRGHNVTAGKGTSLIGWESVSTTVIVGLSIHTVKETLTNTSPSLFKPTLYFLDPSSLRLPLKLMIGHRATSNPGSLVRLGLHWCRMAHFFLRSPALTASNFEALLSTNLTFTVSKVVNLLKKCTKNQEASSIWRVVFALSKSPHLLRAYVVTLCKILSTAVLKTIFGSGDTKQRFLPFASYDIIIIA